MLLKARPVAGDEVRQGIMDRNILCVPEIFTTAHSWIRDMKQKINRTIEGRTHRCEVGLRRYP
jgi:hypothetical protein